MSIAPQALERSVLESKEREELAVIAQAMGVKPASRVEGKHHRPDPATGRHRSHP